MIQRLPPHFRQEIPAPAELAAMRRVYLSGAHTVCREANCPNISACFKEKAVTFMILGNVCTRYCAFCNISDVGTGFSRTANEGFGRDPAPVLRSLAGKPVPTVIDETEPERIALLVKKMSLDYAVITSVSRDDLADGGARIFARTICALRKLNPAIKIETLIPDFLGQEPSLKSLVDQDPDVLAHNIETVPRLYKWLRPQADYRRSLGVLKKAKELQPSMLTKSSLMLGLGEDKGEVKAVLRDLRLQGCDCLCLGQYLAPSARHYPVKKFIDPEEFVEYHTLAVDLGFKAVLSIPLARASFRAKEMYEQTVGNRDAVQYKYSSSEQRSCESRSNTHGLPRTPRQAQGRLVEGFSTRPSASLEQD